MPAILQVVDLGKTYTSGQRELTVLDAVHFTVNEGESVAIVGPSGSGKTTLLGLCAGLDSPSRGYVTLCDAQLDALDEDARALLRNDNVGFIFQNFQLIPSLTALENVMIPLELQGASDARKRATELMVRVGLGDRLHHYPSQLSGGEQQRVSLARAFCNDPRILFCDEPTGNLDNETSIRIEDLLFELNAEQGTTLVIVTHDLQLANKTGRIIELKGGRAISDSTIQPA
jgi:putative ABC transport system ATP-binding protein